MGFDGAQQVGVWVLVVVALLPAVKTIIDWARGTPSRNIGPQPLQVQEAPRFAPLSHDHPQYMLRQECREAHVREEKRITAQFEALQRQVDHVGNKLDTILNQHNSEAEARALRIHARIDVISTTLHELRGEFTNHVKDGKS